MATKTKVQSVSWVEDGASDLAVAVVYRKLRLHPTKGWRPERSERRLFSGLTAERDARAFVRQIAPEQVR